MSNSILIFPAGMPRSLAFLSQCVKNGEHVVGASSLAYDSSRLEYPLWATLPYITDERFNDALIRTIEASGINRIYSPHPVVWNYLSKVLGRLAPGVLLMNSSPAESELDEFRSARLRAQMATDVALNLSSDLLGKPEMGIAALTALYLHSERIPGMCDHDKIRALYEITKYCPSGDIVEIGSWWGKSAYVLLHLSKHFDIGALLCVDPWTDSDLFQGDSSALVDRTVTLYSADEALDVFLANMTPYQASDVNYLRLPSTEAAQQYRTTSDVESTSFGRTRYSKKIALLHIDGNHSYENVLADILAWGDLLVDGGWIVFDDYTWPFGDGPKRVGDDYLLKHCEAIRTAFVMGGALFIQVRA